MIGKSRHFLYPQWPHARSWFFIQAGPNLEMENGGHPLLEEKLIHLNDGGATANKHKDCSSERGMLLAWPVKNIQPVSMKEYKVGAR